MSEREIRKRVGRYIKKDDSIIDSLSMKPFDFNEICEANLIFHDNAGSNLILKEYHEAEDLERAVTKHEGLTHDIRDPESTPPVLQPLNFTEDWERQRMRASKRSKGPLDDEEEFDFEFESQILREQQARNQVDDDGEDEDGDEDSTTDAMGEKEGVSAAADGDADALQATSPIPDNSEPLGPVQLPPERQRQFETQKQNLDKVGKAIKNLQDGQEESHESKPEQGAEFIPVNAGSTASGGNPEKGAIASYQSAQSGAEISKEELEAARKKGYEDGFKLGEEKGSLQLREIAGKITENISDMVGQLQGLRQQILEGAQENFREICQAIAESMIGRELSINPHAFNSLIQSAIKDSITDDQFTIKVHPTVLTELEKAGPNEIVSKLVGDEAVEPGNFKVESKMSVIDGNVRKMVADLLEAADPSIIESQKDKAG